MSWSRTYEGEEPVRVNKWLAQSGVCSRREAEALIAEGRVTIDGAPVEDVGRKIMPGQTLTLDEAGKEALDTKLTVLIHKPVGIVSSQPEGDQVPAVRLLRRSNLFVEAEVYPNSDHKLAPLGRLDMDSRGLLILSEDGVLAKAVIGPDSELDKEYFVQVEGDITQEKIDLLRHGLELDGRTLRLAVVEEVMPGRLRFVLVEGRNRQIRRMCELVELEVVDLIRTRVGPIELGDLPEGMWRPMTAEERAALLEASKPRGSRPFPDHPDESRDPVFTGDVEAGAYQSRSLWLFDSWVPTFVGMVGVWRERDLLTQRHQPLFKRPFHTYYRR